METSRKAFLDTYYWSIDRMCELCSRDDFEEVVNGDSIRQEFDEWIQSKSRKQRENIDVLYLEYIGQGSEYD